MFELRFAEGVEEDLAALRAYDRRIILDAIEKQLKHEPEVSTRNRNLLVKLVPPWHAVHPIWQLRVGEYRVFYDVDQEHRRVYVRAIRRKPPHKTTEGIL